MVKSSFNMKSEIKMFILTKHSKNVIRIEHSAKAETECGVELMVKEWKYAFLLFVGSKNSNLGLRSGP